jgi:hypothetical protein
MKNISLFAIFLSASGVVPGQSTQRAQPIPARATLTLDDGLSVTSDGKGAYVDGEAGVVAFIGGDDGGTFLLRFAAASPRAFNVALTKPADSVATPRRGVLRCDASKSPEILVHDMLSIPVGETASRAGHIQMEIEYANGRASKAYDESFNEHQPDPVARFSVTRTSKSQWIVENASGPDGDVSSLRWASLPPDYPNGGAWTFLGHAHFHTPLRMTITIPSAP